MYTTNVIESLNSQYRKVTKTKLIFPTDQSLQKMLYLATTKITSKWTMRYRGWDLVLNQVSILFDDVLNPEEV
jgi:transposase-like protein